MIHAFLLERSPESFGDYFDQHNKANNQADMPRNASLCASVMPNPSDAITISIHCGSGDHATSIILPRHHHLARKLEELVSSGMTTQTQPLAQQPDVIRALSLVVKYINDSRHEGPDSSIAALFNSLCPPPRRVSAYVGDAQVSSQRAYHHPPEQPVARTRYRRGGKHCARSVKHCNVIGCDNISVSHGLCRGHGGGRRYHYMGCSKSAQSRSVFCWSHGGGRRCEVESCMRCRKSKHFCSAHVHLEKASPKTYRRGDELLMMILNDANEYPAPRHTPYYATLPSLQEALKNTQHTSMID
ncbi:hypothetical protein F441_00206 [Phytophthora nicotianae CJ01A1]|uniref:WRKY19-like zinc finger domain-containing protein n=1 Tax=Phytophthora nicotianae CJ01A1 TaxID=1317063 RepID=W2XZA9_PHYNI|nr:hypothetical protein F441_00206 [Phytophthora nicotianae CJ01A1]